MKSITADVSSDLVINEHTYLRSVVRGNIRIGSKIHLDLHGVVFGNVLLEADSTVYLHGSVEGDVINNGGHLALFGTVKGNIVENSGHTFVSAQAVVVKKGGG